MTYLEFNIHCLCVIVCHTQYAYYTAPWWTYCQWNVLSVCSVYMETIPDYFAWHCKPVLLCRASTRDSSWVTTWPSVVLQSTGPFGGQVYIDLPCASSVECNVMIINYSYVTHGCQQNCAYELFGFICLGHTHFWFIAGKIRFIVQKGY
jgi:hypothetical protein